MVVALCLVGGLDAGRKRKPPLAVIDNTAWIYSGEYRVRAKPSGHLESYTLNFIVDFYDDGSFTTQCLPIEEGMEDVFFSGTWIQKRNKITLIFDAISKILLADTFAADFAAVAKGAGSTPLWPWCPHRRPLLAGFSRCLGAAPPRRQV